MSNHEEISVSPIEAHATEASCHIWSMACAAYPDADERERFWRQFIVKIQALGMVHNMIPVPASSIHVDSGYYLCTDCNMTASFGVCDCDDTREREIRKGFERVLPARFASDPEEDEEESFSNRHCSCCHTTLGGPRYRYSLITTKL